MSLIVAVDYGQVGILAADRAVTKGGQAWDDAAPKLIRCGTGFVAAAGADADACGTFLAAAQRAGRDRLSFNATDLTRLARATLDLFPPDDDATTTFPLSVTVLAAGGRVARLDLSDDAQHTSGSAIVLPPSSPARGLSERFGETLSGVDSLHGLIRAVASVAAEAHELDPRIGAVVDLALCGAGGHFGYLTGDAAEIGAASDAEITERITSAPLFYLKLTDATVPAHAVEVGNV